MKAHVDRTTRAHLVRGALYLFLLIAVCAIPFALAERNTTKPGKPALRPVVGTSDAADSIQKYNLSMPAGTPTPTPTCGGPAAWQPGPDQPPARYAFQAALGWDNLLYVAGGQTADMVPTLYDQVSRYNYTTNTWSNVAPLPVPLGQATIGVIYVYGGVMLPAFTTTDTLLRYDPVANSWTNLGSAGTAGLGNYGGISAFVRPFNAGQLLITDGADSMGVSTNSTHIFTISSGTFSAGPPMIGNRAGHAQGTLFDGRVLVADGFNTASTTVSTVELITGGPCPTATPSEPPPTATATATVTATPTATSPPRPSPTPTAP